MKKSLFFVAAASALMLTACSSENEATQIATQQEAPQAVAFDTYTASVTRAGGFGIQTTSTLQESGKGFGVFAVQSDNTTYSETQTTNFMWNEHVTWTTAGGWTYAPLKYWPNETKDDSQTPHPAHSESSNIDRLSFFAYAPYVAERTDQSGMVTGVTAYSAAPTATAHNATTGATTGIVALSSNNPYVWYVVSDIPSKSVDLLWGVAPAGGLDYQTVNPDYHTTTAGKIAEGMPLVDLLKPSKDQKIKFLFKHALARLGVTVVAAVDQIAPGGDLGAGTKVAVESITIEDVSSTQKLFSEGRLDLKNLTAGTSRWPVQGGSTTSWTIDATHELSSAIKWMGTAKDTKNELDFEGVDNKERNAIAKDGWKNNGPAYFMLIPSHADTDLKVTITYHVFTADSKLVGGYAVTKNVIDQTITIPTLTNNKAYNLKLILGLTSVKLDAEVADWQVDGSTDVNLPKNEE